VQAGADQLGVVVKHPVVLPRRLRCASVGTPIWRVIRLYTVGAVIPGHDVSGTGWQILGRATQSITTMMPEWQCGHSRNDCPVSASKRSR
jgi:hypothetical protein